MTSLPCDSPARNSEAPVDSLTTPEPAGVAADASRVVESLPPVNPWHARAEELATWAKRYLVRTDRWGGYYADETGTHPTTRPGRKAKVARLDSDIAQRHYRATRATDIIGAHTLHPDGGGKYVALDLDVHDGTKADVEANERFALHVYNRAVALGFTPLMYSSNGRGGIHLVIFFSDRKPWVSGEKLFRFIRWLVRDWREFGFSTRPEVFPKQPKISSGGCGSWLRIIGRHHRLPYWPHVYSGERWVPNEAAVEHVLSIPQHPSSMIPPEALVAVEEEKPRTTATADSRPERPGDDFDARGGVKAAEDLLTAAGWKLEADRGDGTTTWTRPGKPSGCSGTLGFCSSGSGIPKFYVFSSSAPPLVAGKSYSPFALLAALEHGDDFAAAARRLYADGYGKRVSGSATTSSAGGPPGRREIVIETNESVVNAQAAEALAADHSIYQRGGELVRVVQAPPSKSKRLDHPAGPTIRTLSLATLRDKLTSVAEFVKIVESNDGSDEIRLPAHVPQWCVAAVRDRGEWSGVLNLEGIVDFPIVRPDGSVTTEPGYDEATEVFVAPWGDPLDIPAKITQQDAAKAARELLELIVDFPIADESHKAAWLAGLLTPLGRYAFTGPVPLVLFVANCPGTGKGKLASTVSLILTGAEFPTATYSHDPEEMKKVVTSSVMAGDRLILLDNVNGPFGNSTLDAVLTSTVWRGRVLGESREVTMPLRACYFATGNNVQLTGDISRRVLQVVLHTDEENPELRDKFVHEDLPKHILANRRGLLTNALKILAGYIQAGSPKSAVKLPPFGSYEGWNRLVRNAVVWCGLEDPAKERAAASEEADGERAAVRCLLENHSSIGWPDAGWTVGELVDAVVGGILPSHAEVRAALDALAAKLDTRKLGAVFRKWQKRNVAKLRLEKATVVRGSQRWCVRAVPRAAPPAGVAISDGGGCGGCGEPGSGPPHSEEAPSPLHQQQGWRGEGDGFSLRVTETISTTATTSTTRVASDSDELTERSAIAEYGGG